MGLSHRDHRGGSKRLGQARAAAWRRWPRVGFGRQSGLGYSPGGGGVGEEAIIIMTIIVTVSLNRMSGKMLIRLFA